MAPQRTPPSTGSRSPTERHGDELIALGGKLAELVASLGATEDLARLRSRLVEIEAEHRRLREEFVEVLEEHAQLLALGVAAERLHGAEDRQAALAVLEDLAVNLVGSEQLAVFDADGERLAATHGLGVAWRDLPAITVGEGRLGEAAAENRVLLAGEARAPGAPLVFIPFRAHGRPAGALALYGLLPQKGSLTAFDEKLFVILQLHAGLALRPGSAG